MPQMQADLCTASGAQVTHMCYLAQIKCRLSSLFICIIFIVAHKTIPKKQEARQPANQESSTNLKGRFQHLQWLRYKWAARLPASSLS